MLCPHLYPMLSLRFLLIIVIAVEFFSMATIVADSDVPKDTKQWNFVNLTISWPSGIMVDSVTDGEGNVFRIGRLQNSAVSLRPKWQQANLKENILTKEECDDLIARSETYSKVHGWSKGRHIDYAVRPTKDLPIEKVFPERSEYESFLSKLESVLFHEISSFFGIDPELIISDLFITRYESQTKENFLGPHRDKSPWSFVLALNDDFLGGGVYFFDSKSMWRPPVGAAVYFSGYNLHGGYKLCNVCIFPFPLHTHFLLEFSGMICSLSRIACPRGSEVYSGWLLRLQRARSSV